MIDTYWIIIPDEYNCPDWYWTTGTDVKEFIDDLWRDKRDEFMSEKDRISFYFFNNKADVEFKTEKQFKNYWPKDLKKRWKMKDFMKLMKK